MPKLPPGRKTVESLKHSAARRTSIPSAEYQTLLPDDTAQTVRVAYQRRNRDLDPQLVWRGKDELDWSDLVVPAPPIYIQEKIHPQALIADLLRQSQQAQPAAQLDLFADFNGIPEGTDRTDFYGHDQNWSNRMILGDSLQVMASLAEREGLRGQVQCIYFDPPYGIKFNSNFQWSTTSRDVKDGNAAHITREPEQVKAFRDTWRDGIHSYLTYLRDRLTVARDLLTDSGSIFVQIGDENVHRVRAVMDEVFGEDNFAALVVVQKSGGLGASGLKAVADYLVWYAKDRTRLKYRQLHRTKIAGIGEGSGARYDQVQLPDGRRVSARDGLAGRPFQLTSLQSGAFRENTTVPWDFRGQTHHPGANACWKTTRDGLRRLASADRVALAGRTIRFVRLLDDFPAYEITNIWDDVAGAADKVYIVQTSISVVERCVLMATDPGDLVLDPTCGSGTTATVAEQWGRRWITIDTSRVALALARARIMGARYPFYLLADSREGQLKEAEVTRTAPSSQPVQGNIRHGFVYERVPHITLKSIANNAEIDVIWDKWQQTLEPLREKLNAALGTTWQEWEIPRELPGGGSAGRPSPADQTDRSDRTDPPDPADLLRQWWAARIARQQAIDASIAAKAEFEYLFDKPYEDKKKVRVAGPFTVESLSPHRMLEVGPDGETCDPQERLSAAEVPGFAEIIVEQLRTAGVQQAHKEDRIRFTALVPWPGALVCAEGFYQEGEQPRRAGIFIGPEFGTVQRTDLVEAAREAADAGFDVLIACAFSYEAHTTEFSRLGRLPVLKARMNADLHMAADLKNTGQGNLFVVFGEPDIELLPEPDGRLRVAVRGVDVFRPQTGEVVSHGPDGIACWLIDTDYNGESFFVRHAYFLGQNDPYGALQTSLKAEIDRDAWESLRSDTSRPFDRPPSGRIAVKVINHLGDEVMKVFRA